MQLTFLGTASCYPTEARAVSCIALKFEDGKVWLFDCGEGSQVQIQKSSLKPGKINKIFITHLHGDHLFGLPGLMCTLASQGCVREDFLLEIYGPHGLRQFVRQTLVLSSSPLTYNYAVHEMMLPEDGQAEEDSAVAARSLRASEVMHPQEREGRNIFCSTEGVWDLMPLSVCHPSVKATPLEHRVPCFGFVVEEGPSPGQLDLRRLQELGLKPGPEYGRLKMGHSVTLPSGTVICPGEVLGPCRQGRKVTILGDTKCSERIRELAMHSDVLVHEATLENSLLEKALENGHSTPKMAAHFAEVTRSRLLVLTHFSQRYKDDLGDPQEGSPSVQILLEEAKECLNEGSAVLLARDLFDLPVPRPGGG